MNEGLKKLVIKYLTEVRDYPEQYDDEGINFAAGLFVAEFNKWMQARKDFKNVREEE